MPSINLGRVVGDPGPKGDRGTVWHLGTGVTGQSTTGTVFSGSGVESAALQDMYLNTNTDDFYTCVLAGNAATAKWAYAGNLKGATGPQGATGPTGVVDSNTPVTFETAATETDINSGESLGTLMGKIKKSISTFRSAIGTLSSLKTSAKTSLVAAINEIFAANNDLWKKIYPVGSIYLSTNNTNPGTFWGGTWVAWGSGRVPVGVNTGDSNFNTVEKTGGESTHTLSVNEMPSHKHQIPAHSHSIGSHTHTIPQLSGSTDNVGEHQHEIITEFGAATDPNASPDAEKIMQIAGVNAGTKRWKAGKINAVGNHIHTVTTNASTTGSAGNGSTGNSAAMDTGAMGNTVAHNNLQPYITCYMWKRTA